MELTVDTEGKEKISGVIEHVTYRNEDNGYTVCHISEEDKPDSEITLTRGNEYASYIFNAIFGDNTPFRFNGNVRNFGYIDNLPEGCCVEVPVVASKDSLEVIPVGKLPDHLAVLVNTTARCEELAVQAALEGDAKKVFWACAFDPLTSAVLSLDEIRAMVDEMLEQNKDYLPWYK